VVDVELANSSVSPSLIVRGGSSFRRIKYRGPFPVTQKAARNIYVASVEELILNPTAMRWMSNSIAIMEINMTAVLLRISRLQLIWPGKQADFNAKRAPV
jgi:hypothetical protein